MINKHFVRWKKERTSLSEKSTTVIFFIINGLYICYDNNLQINNMIEYICIRYSKDRRKENVNKKGIHPFSTH